MEPSPEWVVWHRQNWSQLQGADSQAAAAVSRFLNRQIPNTASKIHRTSELQETSEDQPNLDENPRLGTGLCVLVFLEAAAAQNPKDMNECSQSPNPCGPNTYCINIFGGYTCSCLSGFSSPRGIAGIPGRTGPLQCTDEDECVDSKVCPSYAKCINSPGNYTCICKSGFVERTLESQVKGRYTMECQDMDECSQSPNPCGPNTNCTNIFGAYTCSCLPGFSSPRGIAWIPRRTGPLQCTDINEYLNETACPPHYTCQNTPGSYDCTFSTGFTFSNSHCEDVNECASPINISCGAHANCVNTEGSYHCACSPGYALPSGEKTFQNASVNDCQGRNLSGILCLAWESPKGLSTELRAEKPLPAWATSGQCPLPPQQNDWCFNLTKDIFSRNCDVQAIANNLDIRLDQVKGSQVETAQIVTFYLEIVQNVIYEFAFNLPLGSRISEKKKSVVIQTLTFEGGCNKSNLFHLEAGNERMDFDSIPMTEKNSKVVAVLISYASIGSIIDERFVSKENLTTSEELVNFQLNSKVVSGTIGNRKGNFLSMPVNFTFQHIRMRSGKEKPLCVYWNKTFWSNQGCKTTWYNDSQTVCSCTHLSSFAVLMASVELEEDPMLTVITYVGLSLSLLCLFLAALTFLLCRAIKGTSTFLHLQLSLCLFLANLLFLIGIKQTQHKIMCSIIAGGLHYLYLAAFTWMFLEGLHIFLTMRNIKVANYSRTHQFKKRFMYPSGYGIPAVIVAVSAASSSQHYGTDRYCWLKVEKGFIWSFIGPVCIISLINLSFYLITLWILKDRILSHNQEVSTIQNTRTLTIKALAQLFILGCSWSVGFFIIDSIPKPAQSVIAYIFTIINSLQGVYIFLVYCVLSRQVQDEYKKCFKRIKAMSETDTYVLSTSNSHSRAVEK
ncbi:adhesion G protein-coupled receptor E3-like [Notamacropus eugenii]|uniref:adhesion G protein-coupled receptor E3-like n=1 Tax=Notamacropus eugenii TaxID=9315 RepID=UPI003B6837A7